MKYPGVDELIIGPSRAMHSLREAIRRAAPRRGPVLIQGATGAGKELVAQGLHAESGRSGSFVAFNIAAIPESLFESELHGHVRGAFSGAIRDRAGLLRRAVGGTAFMDEIGELPTHLQARLLRVIDTQEVWPVGADSGHRVDFRLLTATNRDLAELVRRDVFRADLLFRLRGIQITVPSLADRPDDIVPLAEHFLAGIATECGAADVVLTPGAARQLETYAWPGNVRELRHTLEHAAYLSGGLTITETHVSAALTNLGAEADLLAGAAARERELRDLLDEHAGDVGAVARALGVDRSTAYRRMRRLGIVGTPREVRSESERRLGSRSGRGANCFERPAYT